MTTEEPAPLRHARTRRSRATWRRSSTRRSTASRRTATRRPGSWPPTSSGSSTTSRSRPGGRPRSSGTCAGPGATRDRHPGGVLTAVLCWSPPLARGGRVLATGWGRTSRWPGGSRGTRRRRRRKRVTAIASGTGRTTNAGWPGRRAGRPRPGGRRDRRRAPEPSRSRREPTTRPGGPRTGPRRPAGPTRGDPGSWRGEWLVYAGKLSLAQTDFQEGHGALEHRYLDECQWNLRGWEHRHLWTRFNARTHGEAHRRVSSVAFSPDGKRIVTGSEGQDGEGVGRGDGPGAPHPQGHSGRGLQRGVQPRRQAHRHRAASDTDGRRCGTRRTGQELLSLKGHTGTGSAAWRSAPTANASSPAAGT